MTDFTATRRFFIAGTAAVVLIVTACFAISVPHGFTGTTAVSVQHDVTPVAEPFQAMVFKSRPQLVAQAPALAPRNASIRNWQLSFRARAMRRS